MLVLLLLPLLWAGSLQRQAEYKLQVPEVVTVQEGLCVRVPCSFSYPRSMGRSSRPLFIYWFREGDSVFYSDPVATNNPGRKVKMETKGRFRLLGDTKANDCSLSIRGAKRNDNGSYFFYLEKGNVHRYPVNLKLWVTALTEKPVIHMEQPLKAGHPARLNCNLPGSCLGGEPVSILWTGDIVNSMEPGTLSNSVLTITPRPQDHDTNLTCSVKLQGTQLTTKRTIHLNVSYAPRDLHISLFFRNGTVFKILQNATSLPIMEGQALQMHCAAESNPPAQLSWNQESPSPNASHTSNSGILELPLVGPAEGGGFTCCAQNALGSQTISLSISVVSLPQLLSPSCSWEAEGLYCICSSRGWPTPSLHWRLREELLKGNSSNTSLTVTSSSAGPWTNSSLKFHKGLRSALWLSCEAQNAHGAKNSTMLILPGKSMSCAGFLPVLTALGGAGVMALLSVCLCLIIFCMKKAYVLQTSRRPKGMDHEDPVMGIDNLGSSQESWSDSPRHQASPAGSVPSSREEQELYYASLTFQGIKLQESREATDITKYSAIRASK
uniref:sialic acid-binding Ig-like lectin 5 n=1 Tax=Jaculus jaculus TaxID=51337 RepID=UPI001E1AF964|nr:sialic acid-binding Ig-like lectin 5 [Jaculus jaculus]